MNFECGDCLQFAPRHADDSTLQLLRGCLSPGSRSQYKRSDAQFYVHATVKGSVVVLLDSYSLASRKRSGPFRS